MVIVKIDGKIVNISIDELDKYKGRIQKIGPNESIDFDSNDKSRSVRKGSRGRRSSGGRK